MRGFALSAAIAVTMVAGAAPAEPQAPSPSAATPPAKAGAYRTFDLTHLVLKLPAESVFETYRLGGFCLGNYKKTWSGGQQEVPRTPEIMDMVKTAARDAGFKLASDTDNVFEKSTETTETELAAIITDIQTDYCLRGLPGNNSVSGTETMSIEWQVYDKLQKTFLAKIPTTATFEQKTPAAGTAHVLFVGVFKANLAKLTASDAFRTALLTPEGQDSAAAKPTKQTPIPLPGSLGAGVRPVGDAVASVVLIFAGESEGSGFLVSTDGLVMTDRHVVGDAKYVKVRWADGIEGLGEVVRSDKVRDVALVKTDPRGRKPLGLRREALQPGDAVFAIGSPGGDKFQSTVTRGIVSANRTFDGLDYIQSDVSVNHGSSGGPLLDEKGRAVGLTEIGYTVAGAPAGLNLFTPVSDALDFLAAEPK